MQMDMYPVECWNCSAYWMDDMTEMCLKCKEHFFCQLPMEDEDDDFILCMMEMRHEYESGTWNGRDDKMSRYSILNILALSYTPERCPVTIEDDLREVYREATRMEEEHHPLSQKLLRAKQVFAQQNPDTKLLSPLERIALWILKFETLIWERREKR